MFVVVTFVTAVFIAVSVVVVIDGVVVFVTIVSNVFWQSLFVVVVAVVSYLSHNCFCSYYQMYTLLYEGGINLSAPCKPNGAI